MDLTEFEFEGYHYDKNTASKCGSVFYFKDDNEDDWLEIIPLSNSDETCIILTVEGCETVKAGVYQNRDGELVNCM